MVAVAVTAALAVGDESASTSKGVYPKLEELAELQSLGRKPTTGKTHNNTIFEAIQGFGETSLLSYSFACAHHVAGFSSRYCQNKKLYGAYRIMGILRT